jgi:carbon monoxide dehydrogenase subunit G
VQLTHSFVIPAGIEETWTHFQDIATVAECFPGAKVTSAEGDDFQGTAKVKLGPVALQYSGAGSFIERDETARLMVFEAKGKDKRGNGTAGATVRLTFAEASDGTRADVVTDLSVTGRPAQFGSRMMQEVSDKLLGQFVECLQQQVGSSGSGGGTEAEAAAAATGLSADDVAVDAAAAEGAAVADQGASLGTAPTSDEGATTTTPSLVPRSGGPGPSTSSPPRPSPTPQVAPPGDPVASGGGVRSVMSSRADKADDALDLGATVLPVLARMYGKHLGAGLVVLVVLWLLRRVTR